MKKKINKKTLILLSLLLLLPLFSGCFLCPPTNQSPTIISTPITSATVGVLYTYDVNATDPDSGDTLNYSLTTNPSGMTIDSGTGEISWTPTSEQIGDNDVTVEASDGSLTDTQSFIIVVSEAPPVTPSPPPPPPINHAPTITSTPDTLLATVGVLYTYDVEATDPNGDTLTYSLTTKPAGMDINDTTGVINWTPTIAQIGDHNVTVEVSDGEKSTTQSFTITVHDVLTEIVVLPETMTLFEGGETETITSITAHYNDASTANLALADCTYGSDDESVATVAVGVVTSVNPGTAIITVTYIEGGITQTDTVGVTVNAIELTEIVVLPENMTLFEGGETETITSITAHYNNGATTPILLDDPNCTYSSDTPAVATVAVGVVTAVGAGTATITVTYTEGGIPKQDTVAVTVNPVLLDHIVVLPETMDLFEGGETETITSIIAHYNNGATTPILLDDPNCTYSSDTPAVATVAVGVVTAVGAGTATITVTYTEGLISKQDTVEVSVDSANLELTPPTQSINVGNPVTINILVENVTDLMGANITLNFDATKLQHVSSTAGSFFTSAFVIPTADNINGSVIMALTTLAEKPSGTGNIITVVFNTVATGVADITFGATTLRDKNNDDIVHTKGSGCSVTIN